MQNRGLKLSSLAFNNETGITKNEKFQVPNDIDLYQLLRSFKLVEKTPEITEEIEKLRSEKDTYNNTIAQLKQDLQFTKQQNQELTSSLKNLQLQLSERSEKDQTTQQNQQNLAGGGISLSLSGTQNSSNALFPSQEPPTVSLLNAIFSDMMQIMNVIEPSERKRIIKPLETIIKYHPLAETRSQCISLMLNLWDEPNDEQRMAIISSLEECCTEDNQIESEVLPVVSSLLGSTNAKILCLVAESVAGFSQYCAPQLRSSLLLSIIKQLSEYSNPMVRVSAAKSGAKLIESFLNDSNATDKLPDLLTLCRQLVFDPDAAVQQAALQEFVPSIGKFTQVRRCAGREFCEYWLKYKGICCKVSSSISKISPPLNSESLALIQFESLSNDAFCFFFIVWDLDD